MKKVLLTLSIASFGFISYSQDDLTPDEIKYRDSIAALNQSNAALVTSQNAYNAGIEAFKAGNYTGAISKFSESIAADPNFTPAYYNKIIAENKAEKYNDAIKTCDQLISMKPGYSKAYFQRGRAYQGLNNYLQAEKDYQKSIELDPKNPKSVLQFWNASFFTTRLRRCHYSVHKSD
ncbi:MAG: tetratricopeptide repeat protein [Crocinitomicaceae bacterium]|nr:tetratricopeptide repeat protein [Crocinitomicaceae bacterium]